MSGRSPPSPSTRESSTNEEVVRRPDPGRRAVRDGARRHGHERVDLARSSKTSTAPSPRCRPRSPSTRSRWPRSCCSARSSATSGVGVEPSSSARSSTRSAPGTTALAPTMGVLFLGWSIIEGLGAVLVIPAVAALIADNYEGRDRITAFAVIGAVSGAAVAAGPLIGGFLTTYASWRVVFAGRGRHHDLRRDLRPPDRREERAAQDPDRRAERHPVGARS